MSISIVEVNIATSKFSIVENSKEEENFIKDVSSIIKSIKVSDLSDIDKFKFLYQVLKMHGGQIQNKSTSQGTLKAGGMMNVT